MSMRSLKIEISNLLTDDGDISNVYVIQDGKTYRVDIWKYFYYSPKYAAEVFFNGMIIHSDNSDTLTRLLLRLDAYFGNRGKYSYVKEVR